MHLLILIFFLLVSASTVSAGVDQAKAKYNNGTKVYVVYVGTSVGVGYRATHTTGYIAGDPLFTSNDDSLSGKLIGSGTNAGQFQVAYQKAIVTTGTGSNPQILSWAQQFYNALRTKNSTSIMDNQSGNGWDIGNHVSRGTISYILSLSPAPDCVILGTTINDWDHLTWSNYTSTLSSAVNNLVAAGIPVVLLKENDVYTVGHGSGAGTYDSFGDYADTLSASVNTSYPGMTSVLDFRTPTRSAILANGGYTADRALSSLTTRMMYDDLHPAQHGHDVMAATAINFFTPPPPPTPTTASHRATMRATFR